MHEAFREGFEKQALSGGELAAGLGLLGLLAGAGAMTGHEAHVGKKLMHARQGSEYTPETFIERHPKAMGAATLGIAPLLSMVSTQAELDRANPRVRDVLKEHPLVGGMMSGA